MYANNKIYSNYQGAVISPRFYRQSECNKVTGFLGWKNSNFGLMFDGNTNAVFQQNILIENQIGITATLCRLQPICQTFLNISVTVRNTTFVGQTSSFDCGDMVWVRSNRLDTSLSGMSGIVFPEYTSAVGLTKMENVTFAKYNHSICQKNYALRTNLGINELQRPIYSERIKLFDVDHANKVFFQRTER
jgi:hypothetical protein